MPTDVAAPLPALDLTPGDTLTVTCDDPAAVITRLTVYVYQTPLAAAVPLPEALLAHLPGENA